MLSKGKHELMPVKAGNCGGGGLKPLEGAHDVQGEVINPDNNMQAESKSRARGVSPHTLQAENNPVSKLQPSCPRPATFT